MQETHRAKRLVSGFEASRLYSASLANPAPNETNLAGVMPMIDRKEALVRFSGAIADQIIDHPEVTAVFDKATVIQTLQDNHDSTGQRYAVIPHPCDTDRTVREHRDLLTEYQPGSQLAEALFAKRMQALGGLGVGAEVQ